MQTEACSLESRVRSFSLLYWHGMPHKLNPRKLAKLGYKCIGLRNLKCSDEIACGVEVPLKEHLAFADLNEQNNTMFSRVLLQLKKAHSPQCSFKDGKKGDFPTNFSSSNKSVLSRKEFYLRPTEIFNSIKATWSALQDSDFNFIDTRDIQKLLQINQESKQDILALTGWNLIKVLPTQPMCKLFQIECVSCFRNVLVEVREGEENSLFDPLRSHLKHCYFASTQSNAKESAWQVLHSMNGNKCLDQEAQNRIRDKQQEFILQATQNSIKSDFKLTKRNRSEAFLADEIEKTLVQTRKRFKQLQQFSEELCNSVKIDGQQLSEETRAKVSEAYQKCLAGTEDVEVVSEEIESPAPEEVEDSLNDRDEEEQIVESESCVQQVLDDDNKITNLEDPRLEVQIQPLPEKVQTKDYNDSLPGHILQTDFTPGSGNALQACVASMFGHQLENVPNFVTLECGYEQGIREYVLPKVMRKVTLAGNQGLTEVDNDRYCILRGKSPRGEHGHVVIATIQCFMGEVSFDFVWDPHPDATFLDRSEAFGWFMVFDEAKEEKTEFLTGTVETILKPDAIVEEQIVTVKEENFVDNQPESIHTEIIVEQKEVVTQPMSLQILFNQLQSTISDQVPGALNIFNEHLQNNQQQLEQAISQPQEPSEDRVFKEWFSEEVPQQGLFWWQGQFSLETSNPDGWAVLIQPGKLVRIAQWKQRIFDGVYLGFTAEGQKQEGNFKDGKVSGKMFTRNPDGSTEVSIYQDGNLIRTERE